MERGERVDVSRGIQKKSQDTHIQRIRTERLNGAKIVIESEEKNNREDGKLT